MHNPNQPTNEHLFAALPAFIGYYPSEALVLVAVTAADDDKYLIGNVMVQDLTTMAAEPTSSAHAFLQAFGNEPILKVIGIIVTDRPHDLADLPLRLQVNDFTSACRTASRQSIEFAYLPRFSAGATWIGYCHAECRGTLSDPATSASALSLALEGYQIHENRDALAALFARAPNPSAPGSSGSSRRPPPPSALKTGLVTSSRCEHVWDASIPQSAMRVKEPCPTPMSTSPISSARSPVITSPWR